MVTQRKFVPTRSAPAWARRVMRRTKRDMRTAFVHPTTDSIPLRQFSLVVPVVELRLHAVDYAFARQPFPVLPRNERILHPVRDAAAALRNIHACVVGVDLARRTRLAAGIVRTEP